MHTSNYYFFPDETLITVRGLGLCKQYNYKIQEFARIIFVDDLKNHVRNVEDHRPLKKRPAFELQDILKIVCFVMIDE